MNDLKVTVIQTAPVWEDVASNLSLFDEKIGSIREDTDLVVLPEMFTTGFSKNVEKLAEDMEGSSIRWLLDKSRQLDADITGSVIIRDGGRYFNRLLWAKPDGVMLTYDKKHLFRMTGEDRIFSPGKELITVELKGWNIRPFICYDLRFPCWTRNTGNPYDAAVFVANWPEKRAMHWKRLLQARAIENQSYVIGVNRVGTDGTGHSYCGDSSLIDPAGDILFRKQGGECVHTESLSYGSLQEYRESFPAWMDADGLEQ